MPGSVTLSQVAEHAGVSLATASRALNGSTRTVNAELRERVLASASALGYSANAQAQAVAKGTSNIVAVMVGDIADPYFSAIVSGVVTVAEERGLVVTISTARSDDERGVATVRALKGQRPRALILAGTRRRDGGSRTALTSELEAMEAMGARVCVIGSAKAEAAGDVAVTGDEGGRAAGGSGGVVGGVVGGAKGAAGIVAGGARGAAGSVVSAAGGADAVRFAVVPVKNREGAGRLAEALVARGYRDFCVLAGDPDLVTPSERTDGFVAGLRSCGVAVPESRVLSSAFSRDSAVAALRELLSRGERPDCVFAVTDVMAVGAMATLREFGLRPGADVGVAGFDDVATLQDVTPSLTTVALPLAEIGAAALELALRETDAGPIAPVEGRVVLRESTPAR